MYVVAAQVVPTDLVAALAIAVMGGAFGWPKSVAHVAALTLMLSTFARSCELVSVLAFGKEFELEDLAQLRAIFGAWANKASSWERWLLLTIVVAVCAGAHWVTSRAFRVVSCSAKRRRAAAAWMALLSALVALELFSSQQLLGRSPLAGFAAKTAQAIRRWGDPEAVLKPMRQEIAAGERRMGSSTLDLRGLGGADVHLIVLESYGRFALRHPQLRGRTRSTYASLARELREAGLSFCSAAVAPAVKGGHSGLAHAELLTSVRVSSEQMRSELMKSDLVALPERFRRAGYRTCEVLPGMPVYWPEGDAFYGVDQSVIQRDLGYDGTLYDFGKMPDQFALHHLLREVIEPARRPLFTMFVGVSSHAPWSAVPPFVGDWRIDEATYAVGPARRHDTYFITMLSDPSVLPAYADSLDYVLRTSVGFALQLKRPSVVVIVGDHQPPIAGSLAPTDLSNDVPIHVISSREELLTPLYATGFVAGFDVPDDAASWPMAELAPKLLEAWSR